MVDFNIEPDDEDSWKKVEKEFDLNDWILPPGPIKIELNEEIYDDTWKKADYDIDKWVSIEAEKRDDCVSGSVKAHKEKFTKENACKLVKLGGYPPTLQNRMTYLLEKEQYQGVIDLVSRYDLFRRWNKMLDETPGFANTDPSFVPDGEKRNIDMDGDDW